ncbi:MAG: transposase [Pleurocapsa sp. MO_226.B13]|nr:transposase [Pleurocapsa sp. MO_226.B13]
MPSNLTNKLSEKFTRFRQDLYNCFNSRQDTVIELLDALAGNIGARSTVELSLNPLFRREYSALYKAIEEAFYAPGEEFSGEEGEKSPRQQQVDQLLEALAQVVPQPKERAFQLWGLDVTPMPRPYARTLEDRSFIYQPNSIKGNKPINIGHPISILSVLPEKAEPNSAPWSIPLSGIRVESSQTGLSVGSEQINLLRTSPVLLPTRAVERLGG